MEAPSPVYSERGGWAAGCRKYVTACEHTWMRFWNMKGEQRQNDCPSSMNDNTYFKRPNEEKLQ